MCAHYDPQTDPARLRSFFGVSDLKLFFNVSIPFLVGSHGSRLCLPLSERQADRVFTGKRDRFCWINRGGHEAAGTLVRRRCRGRPEGAGAIDLHGSCRLSALIEY